MRKSRLSQHKQNKLIELFVAGVTARTRAELVNINKTTAAYYFYRLRLLIYQNSPHMEMFEGEIEADESYFGGTRKGKRGRGAVGKTAVFGLLKRDGKVYTVVVPNTQSATLLPIVSEFNHFRINHSNLKS
ncbi:transposase [Glaesserella parasuis]|nr:transposase [Glaesserella parasuis]